MSAPRVNLLPQPGRLLGVTGITEELIEGEQPGTRQDTFVTDMPHPGPEIFQELDFLVGLRREVGMAPFRGHWVIAGTVPIQNGFPQAGSGGDQRGMAFSSGNGVRVQYAELVVLELQHAVRGGFHVV